MSDEENEFGDAHTYDDLDSGDYSTSANPSLTEEFNTDVLRDALEEMKKKIGFVEPYPRIVDDILVNPTAIDKLHADISENARMGMLYGMRVFTSPLIPEDEIIVTSRPHYEVVRRQIEVSKEELGKAAKQFGWEMNRRLMAAHFKYDPGLYEDAIRDESSTREEPRSVEESMPEIEWVWVIPTLIGLIVLFWVLFGGF